MADCEFLKDCPCMNGPAGDELKGIWIYQYCRGPKVSLCAVRKNILDGIDTHEELTPNGSNLRS